MADGGWWMVNSAAIDYRPSTIDHPLVVRPHRLSPIGHRPPLGRPPPYHRLSAIDRRPPFGRPPPSTYRPSTIDPPLVVRHHRLSAIDRRPPFGNMNTEVSASRMNSIGERLRQERLRQGLDLEQIAELTKITPLMLEAIESDDFDRLPGSFFARSFVRQYARALGLDEEEFESELRRVVGFGHPAAEEAQQAAPMPEGVARPQPVPSARSSPSRQSLGSLVAFLLILVACSALYTLWQKTRSTAAKSQQVSTVQAPSPTPEPPPAATPTPSPEAATPTATPLETPAAEPATTPTPEPGQPPPSALVAESPGIHLELRAISEVWVRVVSDARTLYSGVLQPNEARVFEGADWITLRAGNAAALAATYNGKPLGELGPEGQVRTITFTPSGFKFVTPPAAPAAT